MTDILFADAETSIHDGCDLPTHGHINYALHPDTQIRVWGFALGDEDVRTWEPGKPFPRHIRRHIKNGGLVVCWNAQFDRTIWQQIGPEVGMPEAKLEQFLDAMAQASTSGLPQGLGKAGETMGLGSKLNDGKAVMLECGRLGREQAHPKAWAEYLAYVKRDVALMRDIWNRTMPLAREDWEDYWVSEKINDRGLPMDMKLARGCAGYFEQEKADVTAQVQEISGIKSQWCSDQINKWVSKRLPDRALRMMKKKDKTATREARKEDPKADVVYKLSLERDRLVRLRDYLKARGDQEDVVNLLTVLEWGRSSSAAKFQKIVNSSVNGWLYGAYIFCGAGQTGRFSSRGTQWHNTPRARIGSEALDDESIPETHRFQIMLETEKAALNDLRNKVPLEALQEFGPISRTLSRAARPTIRAKKNHRIVWADYKSIEAVVTPWLAYKAGIEEAADTLTMFKHGTDLYVDDAAKIFGVDPDDVTDHQRQAGKVARLALGFRGGKGAYLVMASAYNLIVSDEEAETIVRGWRDANLWNAEFADIVWEAVCNAIEEPGQVFEVGACRYWFDKNLMNGTLIAQLPSGRCLCYPRAKMVQEEHEELGFETINIHYGWGRERSKGWVGTFIENLVQAAANDILRNALKKLVRKAKCPYIVGHTHDDIITHVPRDIIGSFKSTLTHYMVDEPEPWMEGLPLKAEAEADRYYHK